ncbi:hypothetical protein BCR39DRAFT_146038 [Naematelia encephala]|uniref:Protein CPL1-like domain-containing protein n=1 Tax=Naematelia encephala TaxID=71784 RepID=A0A1Y2BJW3_9TREE|nr:hypothetical protein BCR39DRAFT_146038 [Naematelia encephala]
MSQFKSLCLMSLTVLASLGLVEGRGLFDGHYNLLSKRFTANVCANINPTITVDIPILNNVTVALAGPTCLCLAAGALTASSVASLDETLTMDNNGTLLGTVINDLGVQTVLDLLENNALILLGSQPDPGCDYPTGAIPDSCGSCDYTCPDKGFACNGACVAEGTTCTSGIARRRRSLDSFICDNGLTACAIPGTDVWTGQNFECIDTQSNIESCGACADPIPGRPTGQDCTAIPHTSWVGCQAGSCTVFSCERGYEVDATGTKCVAALVDQSGGYNKRSTPRRARL